MAGLLDSDPETRALAENFILEERLTEVREDIYEEHIQSPGELGDWKVRHENYVSTNIQVHSGTPDTFVAELNAPNLLPELEPNQFVVRVENLAGLVKLARGDDDVTPIVDWFNKVLQDDPDEAVVAVVEDFLSDCNEYRDWRPIFVGFWGEVKDLLDDDDWANKLRDRLGLGHMDPEAGDPIPVLVLRYRIADVIATHSPRTPTLRPYQPFWTANWAPFSAPHHHKRT